MGLAKNLLRKPFFKLFKNTLRFSNSSSNSKLPHNPVLLEEAVNYLDVGSSKTFIDMTFGAGGHCHQILRKAEGVKVYALDRDPVALKYVKLLSEEYPDQIIPMHGKFSDLPRLLKQHGVQQNSIDGILFDFGCSSMQFDEPERGFSYSRNGPLDMRMGGDKQQIAARDIIAKIDESDLAKILRVYGEEKSAKKIAKTIVESRSAFCKIETTKQLADLVSSCLQGYKSENQQVSRNVVAKTFQAIRIFVNNELNEINYGMIIAQRYLKKGGRLVTITFHSLEDTIVKRHLSGNIIEGLANPVPLKYSGHDLMHDREIVESLVGTNWKQLHKHVTVSSEEQITKNIRSRSAKLRAAEKK